MTKVEDAEVETDTAQVGVARSTPMVVLAHHDGDEDDGAVSRVDFEQLLKLYESSFRNIAAVSSTHLTLPTILLV